MSKYSTHLRKVTALVFCAVALSCCHQTPQEIAAEELESLGILPANYQAEVLNAIVRNDAAMLQLLIEAGADIDKPAPGGETLLHLAAAQGQADAARVLIFAGANLESSDQAGVTPTQRAILHGHLHMPPALATAVLEKNGILPEQYTNKLAETCLNHDFYTAHLIQTAGHSINSADSTGCTALHHCAAAGRASAIQFLLTRGANATITNKHNQTALDTARAAKHQKATAVLAVHELHQQGITEELYASALMQAVCRGDAARVTLLHEAGADLTAIDADGNNLVHIALLHNRSNLLPLLKALGVCINARNDKGMTPLFTEISLNRADNIELLHRLGAKMALSLPDGRTPLQYAVTEGHYRCIESLAHAGAKVDTTDSRGNTLLHYCAAHGQQYCMQALLQAGADVHIRNKIQWTPLHYACAKNATECQQLLIAHGAVDDIFTAILANDEAACRRYLRRASATHKTDGPGNTPLHLAARFNRIPLCMLLLEHGADATATDTRDRTAGDCARTAGHTDCMQQLAIEALQQRGITTPYTDALHEALAAGDTDLLRLLIDAGADLHKPDKNGWYVLHAAVRHNKPACIPYLLQRGADPQATLATGYTALHLAVAMGHAPCVKALSEGGANVNARLRSGCTALHLAVRLGRHDCLQYLLAAGADVNMRNERGDTPLLELARWNWSSPDSAAALIQAGADLHATNLMGETAIHAAAISGNKACLAFFISAGCNAKSATHAGKTPRQLAKTNGHKDCEDLLKDAETDSLSATE